MHKNLLIDPGYIINLISVASHDKNKRSIRTWNANSINTQPQTEANDWTTLRNKIIRQKYKTT